MSVSSFSSCVLRSNFVYFLDDFYCKYMHINISLSVLTVDDHRKRHLLPPPYAH